ncbi:hypothetical protein PG994_002930 [Apiospora phragmitis]|uniref:Uncharacterized protein n=1 Tax=Apiospora phragmitis TaxID=2905665 RepID=A0ABR1W6K8_9PEZI
MEFKLLSPGNGGDDGQPVLLINSYPPVKTPFAQDGWQDQSIRDTNDVTIERITEPQSFDTWYCPPVDALLFDTNNDSWAVVPTREHRALFDTLAYATPNRRGR